ncbi:hypothetical protein COBT_001751, partial [Conglomerata obtusa]
KTEKQIKYLLFSQTEKPMKMIGVRRQAACIKGAGMSSSPIVHIIINAKKYNKPATINFVSGIKNIISCLG